MRTLLLVQPEPVADGGWFVRSALHLEGAPWAANVRITVRPGADSEFGQVAHTFLSSSLEKLLTIHVGDLDIRAPVRVLVEFLVRPDIVMGAEAEVAEVVVEGDVPDDEGTLHREIAVLSVRVAPDGGGFAAAAVRRELLGPAGAWTKQIGPSQGRSARRKGS